jgi:RNA polymerase sporulation-specific sigma factor
VSLMDETMKLIEMAHEGDKEARDQLVTENFGLIWSIVRRFMGRGYEPEDLFQIGCIGIMKAIDKFDMSYDVKFSTYAVPMITGEIKRFLRDDGIIKISRSIKEMALKVKRVREELVFRFGREPTVEEIAGEIGASKEEVAASMEAGAEVESLYRSVNKNDENSILLIDKIEEESSAQEELLNRMVLRDLLTQLSDKDREIIIRRYYYNETQSQIATKLGISQVQVSRLEKKILKQMREKL